MKTWIDAKSELPEIGRPVWLANEAQAWIGWRENVNDGDDDQSDWAWSKAAYPVQIDSDHVTRWASIDEPPALSN